MGQALIQGAFSQQDVTGKEKCRRKSISTNDVDVILTGFAMDEPKHDEHKKSERQCD